MHREIDACVAGGDISGIAVYLDDKSTYVRRYAIDAIAVHPGLTDSVLHQVLALEGSTDRFIRMSVARFTGWNPVDASVAVATSLTRDTDDDVRNAAMRALVRHENGATTEALVSLLSGREPATVTDTGCGLFLPFLNPAVATVPEWLGKVYKEEEYSVAGAAARALADRTGPGVVSALVSAVENIPEKPPTGGVFRGSKEDTWAQAAWALAYTSDPAGTKVLADLLELPQRQYSKHVDWVGLALAASRDPGACAIVEQLSPPSWPKAFGRTLSVLRGLDEREVIEDAIEGAPTDFVLHDKGDGGDQTLVASQDRLLYYQPKGLIHREKLIDIPFSRVGALGFYWRHNGCFFIHTTDPDLGLYATHESKLTRPYAQWLARRLTDLSLEPFGET